MTSIQPKTYIFIGRSGCGKGTQVELLTKKLKEIEGDDARPVLHLESGARFRAFIDDGTHSSDIARRIYNTGGLQPSFLSVWIWSNIMVDTIKGNEHIILDGIPRRHEEVAVLASAMKFYGRENVVIVYLKISHEEAVNRMKARHRFDDIPESIANRLSWFETEVIPTIDAFRALPGYTVLDIDGERPIEEVYADIVSKAGLV